MVVGHVLPCVMLENMVVWYWSDQNYEPSLSMSYVTFYASQNVNSFLSDYGMTVSESEKSFSKEPVKMLM